MIDFDKNEKEQNVLSLGKEGPLDIAFASLRSTDHWNLDMVNLIL